MISESGKCSAVTGILENARWASAQIDGGLGIHRFEVHRSSGQAPLVVGGDRLHRYSNAGACTSGGALCLESLV
jgi:hypothetical protein